MLYNLTAPVIKAIKCCFLKNLQKVCFQEEISSAAEGEKCPTDETKTKWCLGGGGSHQQYQGLAVFVNAPVSVLGLTSLPGAPSLLFALLH